MFDCRGQAWRPASGDASHVYDVAGIGFGSYPAAGESLTQRGHHGIGDDRAQIRPEKRTNRYATPRVMRPPAASEK